MRNFLCLFVIFFVSACAGPTGPAGSRGDTGATGQTGAAGQNGTNGTNGVSVSKLITCEKVTQAWSGATFELFSYQLIEYSNGDLMAICSIGSINGTTQAENTSYYRANQVGSSTGYCSVDADFEDADGGYWVFTGLTSQQTVFNDSSSAHNNATVTFASGDCSTD